MTGNADGQHRHASLSEVIGKLGESKPQGELRRRLAVVVLANAVLFRAQGRDARTVEAGDSPQGR